MKTPDWRTCTEEELWHFVGYHLSKAGIEAVLVGGAVVSVYSSGAYRSGDLDFITKRGTAETQKVLESIGFKKVRGRHYEHPECEHLLIEFPPGPIAIGEDHKIVPKKKKLKIRRFRFLAQLTAFGIVWLLTFTSTPGSAWIRRCL